MGKAHKYQPQAVVSEEKVLPSLKLSIHEGNLCIECLIHERTRVHGFGRFLEQYNPQEILITQEAKKKLLGTPYRTGLMGAEFFAGNILAWGDPAFKLVVAFKDVSVDSKAKPEIKKFIVVKD